MLCRIQHHHDPSISRFLHTHTHNSHPAPARALNPSKPWWIVAHAAEIKLWSVRRPSNLRILLGLEWQGIPMSPWPFHGDGPTKYLPAANVSRFHGLTKRQAARKVVSTIPKPGRETGASRLDGDAYGWELELEIKLDIPELGIPLT